MQRAEPDGLSSASPGERPCRRSLVRPRALAPDLPGADMIEGDARDEGAPVRALNGCDAVVSSLDTGLSPFRQVSLLTVATRAPGHGNDARRGSRPPGCASRFCCLPICGSRAGAGSWRAPESPRSRDHELLTIGD
jgi:hypothetical protein